MNMSEKKLHPKVEAWYKDETSPKCNNMSKHAGYWLSDKAEKYVLDKFNSIANLDDDDVFKEARQQLEMELAIYSIEENSCQAISGLGYDVMCDIAETWSKNIRRMQEFDHTVGDDVKERIGAGFKNLFHTMQASPLLGHDGTDVKDPETTISGMERYNRAYDLLGGQGYFILDKLKETMLADKSESKPTFGDINNDFYLSGADEILEYYKDIEYNNYFYDRDAFNSQSQGAMKSCVKEWGVKGLCELVEDNMNYLKEIELESAGYIKEDGHTNDWLKDSAWGSDVPFEYEPESVSNRPPDYRVVFDTEYMDSLHKALFEPEDFEPEIVAKSEVAYDKITPTQGEIKMPVERITSWDDYEKERERMDNVEVKPETVAEETSVDVEGDLEF